MNAFRLINLLLLLILACNGPVAPVESPVSAVDSVKLESEEELVFSKDGFLKSYIGTIGETLQIEMLLIDWGDGDYSGHYEYLNQAKKIELLGEKKEGQLIRLREFVEFDQTGIFEGQIDSIGTFAGTWSTMDSSRVLDFKLEERLRENRKPRLEGAWHRNNLYSPGILIIGNSDEYGFDFALDVFNSGHVGTISGKAVFDQGKAIFSSTEFDEEEPCQLEFSFGRSHIDLDQQSPNFSCGFGMRAFSGGRYDAELEKQSAIFVPGPEAVFSTQTKIDSFKALVGLEAYETFAFNFQRFDQGTVLNTNEGIQAKSFSGAVSGLLLSNEAFIMYDELGKIWAATIDIRDRNESVVRYFTNDENFQANLPSAIEKWRERFKDYTIIFESSGG